MLKISSYSAFIEQKQLLFSLSHTFKKGKVHILMGPNGSGKSTLAMSLLGMKKFTLSPESKAFLETTNLLEFESYKRVQKGLFVSFQSPPSLSGVSVFQMLRIALHGKMEALALKETIEKFSKELSIPKTLLSRSLNEGFSGGERKKMELLQMAILNPQCALLDEIDTGVDIDAQKTIISFLKNWLSPEKTLLIITHHPSFAEALSPDSVTILKNGEIVASGNASLIQIIKEKGYDADFSLSL
ncbi:MAG: Fe-S cluster assembly ATPase SufC [Candidatus Moraniibacteriota bacterium]|nr:MAG: Fe-S cluster assembly ATPase SufC [Candidatus Moranbacteria bacterium]